MIAYSEINSQFLVGHRGARAAKGYYNSTVYKLLYYILFKKSIANERNR